ncbi:hypothetical protein J1605_010272 [Eschrichtius robustus]|uniref:Proprotein convertase subtilisin/kexin type 5 n=1 Tax=Eschrichtius robustus TaxID=9764 RepID=A0AB34GSM3_ESCRO|nr:hypothetical protein J1605_010272 [Eschrichtius robustus]
MLISICLDKHGREWFLYWGECRESCPTGHYPDEDHTCRPCPDNCELCHSSHVCTRCRRGYFLVPSNRTCRKLECGQGEVQDPDYEECMPCEEGCLGCSLGTSSPFFLRVEITVSFFTHPHPVIPSTGTLVIVVTISIH